MKTLVIGANGQIGKQFCELAAQQNAPVKAMIRTPDQAAFFDSLGVETVIGDLEDDFEHAFEGCNRVLFTAGSGGKTGADKTLLVDLYGAIRSIEISKAKGIEQYIMVSALRAEQPLKGPQAIRHYLVAKKLADAELIRSGVPYTIVRPGRLTDAPATGRIRIPAADDLDPITISRANVARFLLQVLGHPKALNQVIDLLDGERDIEEMNDFSSTQPHH